MIETTYSGYINSVYSNAFSADGSTYYDTNSAFKTMHLGPSSDSSKIMGIIKLKLSIIFNEVNGALDNMITAFNSLQTTTQTGVTSQITSFTTSVTDLKVKLQIYLNQVEDEFSVLNSLCRMIKFMIS